MIYPIVIYGSPILRNESVDVTPDYPGVEEARGGYVPDARRGGRRRPRRSADRQEHPALHRGLHPWAEEHPELADYKRVFVNAEIYEESEETGLFNEGCLSCRGSTRTSAARSRSACATWTKISGARRAVRGAAGTRDPARIRPHRRRGLHRPPLAAAPQPHQEQVAEFRQGQVPLQLQNPLIPFYQ